MHGDLLVVAERGEDNAEGTNRARTRVRGPEGE
jgi:hypothetical protein